MRSVSILKKTLASTLMSAVLLGAWGNTQAEGVISDIRDALEFGMLANGEGFATVGEAAAQPPQARAGGQGNALVSVTQSQVQQGSPALINISYNGLVSAQGIAVGFIIPSNAPSESQFIITAEAHGLPNPQFSLFEITSGGDVERAANDNCAQDLTPLVGRDIRNGVNACLVTGLSPGLYYVAVTDVGGNTGNALVSVTQPSGSEPALLNISYNGFVAATGIRPGFIVGSAETFALTAENLGLHDPEMALYQITPAGDQLVASNDDCNQDLTAHVGRDLRSGGNACLLLALQPGAYYLEITGTDAGGGGGGDGGSPGCTDIDGYWSVTETVNITCSAAGETISETLTGTDTVHITQNGCNVSYRISLAGVDFSRSGTVSGNQVNMSGPFVESLDPAVVVHQDQATINCTVNGDNMNCTGSGSASGTFYGHSASCTGNSTASASRL